MPELKNPNSEEFKLFSDLWAKDPALQGHPNGPALAGYAIAGVLSRSKQTQGKAQPARQSVSPPMPTGSANRISGDGSAAQVAKQIVERVKEDMGSRQLGEDDLMGLIQAKNALYDESQSQQ